MVHSHAGHSHTEHSHGHPHGGHGSGEADRRALTLVFALTTAFLIAEVVGGLLTGSLALLADAGHMASDSASIGLALF
nr:cation transporter [Rubrobacter sp.]